MNLHKSLIEENVELLCKLYLHHYIYYLNSSLSLVGFKSVWQVHVSFT